MKRFEEFEHTADIGIKAFGKTLDELFENAAYGMFSVIAGEREVRPTLEHQIELTDDDTERLLVTFLSELLYLSEVRRQLFSEFKVSIDEGILRATCRGEELGSDLSGLGMEVKAVTRHMLEVNLEEGWARVEYRLQVSSRF